MHLNNVNAGTETHCTSRSDPFTGPAREGGGGGGAYMRKPKLSFSITTCPISRLPDGAAGAGLLCAASELPACSRCCPAGATCRNLKPYFAGRSSLCRSGCVSRVAAHTGSAGLRGH